MLRRDLALLSVPRFLLEQIAIGLVGHGCAPVFHFCRNILTPQDILTLLVSQYYFLNQRVRGSSPWWVT